MDCPSHRIGSQPTSISVAPTHRATKQKDTSKPSPSNGRAASRSSSNGARIERIALTSSIASDFFTIHGLQSNIGQPPLHWAAYVVKELIDNALDAAEENGIQPSIQVIIDETGITVVDNGPGIPATTVVQMCDFMVRVSSRAAWVSLDRGAQGQALKTLLAMYYAMTGQKGEVTIRSQGVRHTIAVELDPIKHVPKVIRCEKADKKATRGTSVHVAWPNWEPTSFVRFDEFDPTEPVESASRFLYCKKREILQVVEGFALFNPHASIAMKWRGLTVVDRKATAHECRKWRPDAPTSIHWYSPETLGRLIGSYIDDDEKNGREPRTLRSFIAEFDGLTGSAKQGQVVEQLGASRRKLEWLVSGKGDNRKLNQSKVATLHKAMCEASTPVSPSRLGPIDKDHIRQRLVECGASKDTLSLKTRTGAIGARPWHAQIGFGLLADTKADRVFRVGVNWSPVINGALKLRRPKGGFEEPLDSALMGLYMDDCDRPIVVVIHVAMPGMTFTDKGKGGVVIPVEIGEEIRDTLEQLGSKWIRQAKQEERNDDAKRNRKSLLKSQSRTTIKAAAFAAFEAGYMHASNNNTLPASARQVYYAIREAVLRATGASKLDSGYITQDLLPEFCKLNPELTADWDITYDARGSFFEPHTSHQVSLGTLDVRRFVESTDGRTTKELNTSLDGAYPTSGPVNRYQAVLFVEKEGFLPLFRAAKLQTRFDIAVMSTKGHSNTASRRLIDHLCGWHGARLFTLHDFDGDGFSIAATLGRDNDRYEYDYEFEVIDLGLRIEDIEAYKLQKEPDTPPNAAECRTLYNDGATKEEIAFLRTGYRVELNAFTSSQMIEWLEAKLLAHGVQKVVPDDAVLASAYQRASQVVYVNDRIPALIAEGASHAATQKPPVDLSRRVHARLRLDPKIPWDVAVADIVKESR